VRGGAARSRDEGPDKGLDRRGCLIPPEPADNPKGEDPRGTAKPFAITKREVWEAYKRVKANRGAAGEDDQTIVDFERNLSRNLYKLWNRMASGSYVAAPVRRVEIPKAHGGTRPLGIPTVADRVAQTVVKARLEPVLEAVFDKDSYGYRPERSALGAVGVARQRCWRYDWVLDLDIKAFFDSIDHDLLMSAVRFHTDCRWIVLYIERWLKAPVRLPDGSLVERTQGTPQGGVISPLLANLVLHYAFDAWMRRTYPHIPFERYADDAICHCRSKAEAEHLQAALAARLARCKLTLHPEKTKIVYCKDADRREDHPHQRFDFLGYTFRPRSVKSKYGKVFVSFTPAASDRAMKEARQTIRDWRFSRPSGATLDDLARQINPVVRGWIAYYGRYHRSAFDSVLGYLDRTLARWAARKYKRHKRRVRRAYAWLMRVKTRDPTLFVHWHAFEQPQTAG